MAEPTLDVRLYLGGLHAVVAEANPLEMEVLCETLLGLGIRKLVRCRQAEEARDEIQRDGVDLLLVGSVPGSTADDPGEYGLANWVRQDGPEATRAAPLMMLTGHTQRVNVLRARDCGVSVVLAKPVQAAALFDRLAWLVRDRRPFISVPSYAGPDRRFQKLGPPPGMAGRRGDDLTLEVGTAVEGNMSQDEIDAMMRGMP